MPVTTNKKVFLVNAYSGDAKTLLAFDLQKEQTALLAGFTICCKPGSKDAYYLYNKVQFKNPEDHAQNKKEPAYSTINAPIQKFRWLHVPGIIHQDKEVFYGSYQYMVTPRYFDNKGILQPLDPKLTKTIKLNVEPFSKNKIQLGFTRGFVQSQAFEGHFGKKLLLQPDDKPLTFDVTTIAGKNADGVDFSYLEEYEWSGFTARVKIFSILDEVIQKKSLSLDVFAYDLNEPDVVAAFLKLGKQGRVRIILDSAPLHQNKKNKKGVLIKSPENVFTTAFEKMPKGKGYIKRGKFSRFAHDKVFIVKNAKGEAIKVLTGSTNFSVTGMYVNSNHVIIFEDPKIAKLYQSVFEESWKDNVKGAPFKKAPVANKSFFFPNESKAKVQITFSPHTAEFADACLKKIVARIKAEKNSVLFAVMDIGRKNSGPIFPELRKLHTNPKVFTYGVSDNPDGIMLYKPSSKSGVLVTGKPTGEQLPAPFNQEVNLGLGHQIHHKFIVCGFNSKDPVVYCGSSNLALLGEQQNGDNLIAIHDKEIATAFALEALALVDHFHFRNINQTPKGKKKKPAPKPYFLNQDNKWALPYFNKNDLHYSDRTLF